MPQAIHIIKRYGFFRDLITQDAKVNLLVGYDSKSITCGSTEQGSMFMSILNGWTFPPQSDGTPALVGISTHGAKTVSSLDKTMGHLGVSSTVPGNYTYTGFTAIGAEPGVNAESGLPYQHYGKYSILAGTARNAWDGSLTATTTGIMFSNVFGGAPVQLPLGGQYGYPSGSLGTDIFSGKSTTLRFIGHRPGANGPTDTRITGGRMLHGNTTVTANYYAVAGSPVTLDFSGTAGPFSADVSAGSGFGCPVLTWGNPAAVGASVAYLAYCTGVAVFRDTGSVGVRRSAGVTVGVMAVGGGNGAQFGSGLGCTDMGTTPSPYYSTANAQTYLNAFIGMPTHVLIYCGHNNQAAEHTDFTTYLGGGGFAHTWRDHMISMVNQMKLLCSNQGTPVPKFLFVFREWNDHDKGVSNNDAAWDACVRNELIDVCRTTDSEMIDLWGETWDGVTTDYNGLSNAQKNAKMPYTKRAHVQATAGSGAGPVEAAASDWLHNSVTGQLSLARMVWDIGMEKMGLKGGPKLGTTVPRITAPVPPRPIASRLR